MIRCTHNSFVFMFVQKTYAYEKPRHLFLSGLGPWLQALIRMWLCTVNMGHLSANSHPSISSVKEPPCPDNEVHHTF